MISGEFMTPQERKKLEGLARTLEEALSFVRELLPATAPARKRDTHSDFDVQAILASLRTQDRPTAETRLSELKQHELGALFVAAGGPASDRKKPKVWLVEQILWRIFDFERGHEAIRSKGAAES